MSESFYLQNRGVKRFVRDVKISDLAEQIEVSARSVQRWIYEGYVPNLENQKKVAKALK